MATLLLESPLAVAAAGLALAIVSYAFCKLARPKRLSRSLAGVAVVTLLMFTVEWFVETDREQIEAAIGQMAADLERNDVRAALSHLHSSAAELHSEAETLLPAFFFEEVDILRVSGIRVDGRGASRKATAEFNVAVTGRDRDGTVQSGRIPRFVILTLRPESGAWRVIDVEDRDPRDGFIRRTS